MGYEETISRVAQVIEGVGAATMVIGGATVLAAAVPAAFDPARRLNAYQTLRRNLGRVILLGLEILIIGDIIRTIIVEPTIKSVIVLAIIVVIRIVLSFALEAEIDGRLPGRRTATNSTPSAGSER
ncbi:MAG TPA: DUF1622 domain-containing protein [Ilumatobacteraceae bacterium]|nr:DUF1622 domain-containing protein [Ilumatobacteraceae bacterium]